jgi:hypothetical protein
MTISRALLTQRQGDVPPRRRSADSGGFFLAETYLQVVDARSVDDITHRLEAAAAGQRRGDRNVRCLGSAGVPGDESFLVLFAAPSVEAVAQTIEAAKLTADRIVPVLWRAGAHEATA